MKSRNLPAGEILEIPGTRKMELLDSTLFFSSIEMLIPFLNVRYKEVRFTI